MDIYTLLAQGHRRLRLPRWNPHAYIQVREGDVWADLFDVVDGRVRLVAPMLVASCAQHQDWRVAIRVS